MKHNTDTGLPAANLKRSRKNVGVLAAWLCGILLFVAVFLIGPSVLRAYDDAHLITKTCQVTSANPETSSTVSRTGIGRSNQQIVIESADCGTLLLRVGVTKENRADVAAELTSGDDYRFIIGEGSWNIRDLLRILRVTPEVQSFTVIS